LETTEKNEESFCKDILDLSFLELFKKFQNQIPPTVSTNPFILWDQNPQVNIFGYILKCGSIIPTRLLE